MPEPRESSSYDDYDKALAEQARREQARKVGLPEDATNEQIEQAVKQEFERSQKERETNKEMKEKKYE